MATKYYEFGDPEALDADGELRPGCAWRKPFGERGSADSRDAVNDGLTHEQRMSRLYQLRDEELSQQWRSK